MDDLLKRRMEENMDHKNEKKKRSRKTAYSVNGRVIRGKLTKGKKIILGTCAGLLCVCALLYIPPVFYEEPEDNTYIPIIPDAASIKTYQTYLKNHPNDDFDGDGLDNAMENDYGTDVWKTDTDGDGLSDYAELFIKETSPLEFGYGLLEDTQQADEESGQTLSVPYKVDDIIFWPETYEAKAYGGVVRSLKGYRFCDYTGWVRFPGNKFAYGYRDNIHYELEYRNEEQAYWIDTSDEIILYDEPLKFVYRLSLPFREDLYLEDDLLGEILNLILPEKGGIICCHRVASIDADPVKDEGIENAIQSPLINRSDDSRFSKNMNSLRDLSWLRRMIEEGECVAVSLYSGNVGESIGIIYGYTDNGHLLVADEKLNPVGIIKIYEMARRVMDQEGVVKQESWFEWEGLGFSSKEYGDRICFFASTLTGNPYGNDKEGNVPVPVETETPDEERETVLEETEVSTENDEETEVESETVPETKETELETVPETELMTETMTETKGHETENKKTQETEKNTEKDKVITFEL